MSDGKYIDGVPFILRKSFYPIPPFEFREIVPPPDNIESYEYDFTFERDTISSTEAYHEEKDKLEQILAERRARQAEERHLRLQEERQRQEQERQRQEEERQRQEEERQRLEEKRRQEQEEEEERLALTFPVSLTPSQNSFIPHLPPPPWTPPYYHPTPTTTNVAPFLDHQPPLAWLDPTASHSSTQTPSVTSTPSFISTQFPFLSRFARTNRYDN